MSSKIDLKTKSNTKLSKPIEMGDKEDKSNKNKEEEVDDLWTIRMDELKENK